jgi:hypothetical protein
MGVRGMAWLVGTHGRELPHQTFWAAESRKSGVAPARFSSLPAAAFEVPVSEVPISQNVRRGQGEDLGTDESEG